MTKWTYHKNHSFVECTTGTKYETITQLYKIGIYAITNGEASLQFSMNPSDLVKTENYLKKQEAVGKIKELKFNNPITVQKVDSFYKEILNE